MWQADGWGSHARIGVLAPHNDVVPEGEFWAMAPPGVSVHAARVPLGWRGTTEPALIGSEAVRAFAEPPHLDAAAELLAAAPLNVITYAFTSSSYVLGAATGAGGGTRTHDLLITNCPRTKLSAPRITLGPDKGPNRTPKRHLRCSKVIYVGSSMVANHAS